MALEKALSEGKPFSLLVTDIDHFKSFNDKYGHLTGDQVLRLVATSVKQNVKGQDIASRYGGEEFAHHSARHDAASGGDRRRPHPSCGDGQGTGEALDRRKSRPRHDLDRRRELITPTTMPRR